VTRDETPAAPEQGSGYAVPEPSGEDPQRAAQLNAQGFELLRQGRAAQAIPLLEQAVRLAPPGGVDPYAYALFNLGTALREAGRSGDAVAVLERRLSIPDQTDVVRDALELARQAADG
jgi:Flp pilus assembly protein TadD